MRKLTEPGRFFFAVAMLAFGVQHFLYAITGSGIGPPWTPSGHIQIYVAGIILLGAAASLGTGKLPLLGGVLLAIACLMRVAFYDIVKLAASPRDPGPWTSGGELVSMAGAALVLGAILAARHSGLRRDGAPVGALFQLGRLLFAVPLFVFGIQHFLYARFIATLITPWIPGHLFWAYFVGVAFIAAGLAILSGWLAPLAATLLGTMFFLWVVVLHAPRVAHALHNGNEWTSLLVALAMSGGAFAIAGATAETR